MTEQYIGPELSDWFSPVQLFQQVDQLEGEVFRQVARRRTIKVSLGAENYFVKIHHGVGWGEIFKNLLQGRLPVLGARNEWLAIKALRAAGVPTMEGVLYCESGGNPALKRSAILTRSLENRISLEDYEAGNPMIKRYLIELVATMAKRMHGAGVNHRDYYLCHFLLDQRSEEPQLNVIDLHRAQLRTKVPQRWLVKDLGGLLFSALEKGMTKRDLLRFVRVYSGDLSTLRINKALWRSVICRARKLYLQDHYSIPQDISRLLEPPRRSFIGKRR